MTTPFPDSGVSAALERALKSARHLRARDSAAVAAARALAKKIDAWDTIAQWAVEDAAEDGGRPKVPANDNVSLASFLKYLDALGLLPGEAAAPAKPGSASVSPEPPADPLAVMRKGLRSVQ
jgi:hypothetical protein